MTFDVRDKAIIKASALVGYCESAPKWIGLTETIYTEWRKRLLEYSNSTGASIAAVFATPISQSTGGSSDGK